MNNNSPRSGRASTVVLIVLLLTAALVTAGLVFLAGNVLDGGIDLHLDFSKIPTRADSPAPVETSQPKAEEPKPDPDTFVISMLGDCTLASSQRSTDFDRVIEANGVEWPFSGTVDILSADDFTMANLECSFSDDDLLSSTTFAFHGPAAYAQILSNGSVEAVTNGNNHTLDYNEKGVEDTRAAVEGVNVGYVSAKESKIFKTERGLKIGIYCPGWRNNTLEGVEKAIPALREKGADIIIYAPHWGEEGKYHPNAEQELVAHAAIDAGADIVCGTHPHVMQRMEEYNDGIIFYSLGNFSFGGNNAPRDRDSVIAQVTVTKAKNGSFKVSGYELIPCCLSSSEGINDYRPVPYEKDSEFYARALSKLDGTFSGPDLTVDYSFLYN